MVPREYFGSAPKPRWPGRFAPSTEALFQSTSGTLVGVEGRLRRCDTNPNIGRHVNQELLFCFCSENITYPDPQPSASSHHRLNFLKRRVTPIETNVFIVQFIPRLLRQRHELVLEGMLLHRFHSPDL